MSRRAVPKANTAVRSKGCLMSRRAVPKANTAVRSTGCLMSCSTPDIHRSTGAHP